MNPSFWSPLHWLMSDDVIHDNIELAIGSINKTNQANRKCFQPARNIEWRWSTRWPSRVPWMTRAEICPSSNCWLLFLSRKPLQVFCAHRSASGERLKAFRARDSLVSLSLCLSLTHFSGVNRTSTHTHTSLSLFGQTQSVAVPLGYAAVHLSRSFSLSPRKKKR